jgi:hypothetical protein
MSMSLCSAVRSHIIGAERDYFVKGKSMDGLRKMCTKRNREVMIRTERETTTKAKAVEGGIIALATTTTTISLDFGLQGTC